MPDTASPRPSAILMAATYATGAVGLALGFWTVTSTPASLSWACLLAVGAAGLLSFLRHSVFHRSDAVRMGWDLGERNNFQIEVGLANLAWGLAGILAVLLDWGIRAQATTFVTFGLYLSAVATMMVVSPGGKRRAPGPFVALLTFGVMLLVLGVVGMNAG